MGGSPGEVREVSVTQVKRRKGCRMSCGVDEAEGLEMRCDVGEVPMT